MKRLYIKENRDYLIRNGIEIDKRILSSIDKDQLPALDTLIDFSNKTGININDFLFVEIAKRDSVS